MSEEFDEEYEERRRRRNARNEEMRKRKKKQQMIRMLMRRLFPIAGIILAAVILIINGRSIIRGIQGYPAPTKTDTGVTVSPAVSENVTQTSDGSEGDLQAGADDAQVEVDKSQQNIEDGGNAQEDSSNDQKIDSFDTESGSPDISNGKLSADEVNLRLRQVVTNDHRQQVIVSGVQASLPDMTALLEQAEEAQAQILKEQKVYTAQTTDATTSVDDEVQSTNGIFIDLATGNILFDRDAHTRINPASMTKVLTVLVAAEHVTDWSDTFEITPEITNYSYVHDCSAYRGRSVLRNGAVLGRGCSTRTGNLCGRFPGSLCRYDE